MIAIIAILAAILFPVFARARENARRSSCQSNLKQIGLGILQYSQDYDEKLVFMYHEDLTGPRYYMWYDINPYIKSGQIWKCPSDPVDRSQVQMERTLGYFNNPPAPSIQFSSYLANYNIFKPSGTGATLSAINMAMFENTAERISLGETDGNYIGVTQLGIPEREREPFLRFPVPRSSVKISNCVTPIIIIPALMAPLTAPAGSALIRNDTLKAPTICFWTATSSGSRARMALLRRPARPVSIG